MGQSHASVGLECTTQFSKAPTATEGSLTTITDTLSNVLEIRSITFCPSIDSAPSRFADKIHKELATRG